METTSPSVQAEQLLRKINGETWRQKHLLETVPPDKMIVLIEQLQQIQKSVLQITSDLQSTDANNK